MTADGPVPFTPEEEAAYEARIAAFDGEVRAHKWEAIKAERERRKAGGAAVGGYWFHTDDASRIQWLGLKDQVRDILAEGGNSGTAVYRLGQPLHWKTMSGAFVPVTVQTVLDVVNATADLDALAFVRAEQHRAALYASQYPGEYDYSTGWPASYGDQP